MQNLPKPLVWAGMALMLVSGSIHLIVAPYALEDAAYKGGLLVAAAIGALIAATGIQESSRVWGWGLGSLVALIALAGYVANSTVGLPGLPAEPGAWHDPLGIVALVTEGALVVLAVVAFLAARQSLPRTARRLRA
jgi:hypothetical protein